MTGSIAGDGCDGETDQYSLTVAAVAAVAGILSADSRGSAPSEASGMLPASCLVAELYSVLPFQRTENSLRQARSPASPSESPRYFAAVRMKVS